MSGHQRIHTAPSFMPQRGRNTKGKFPYHMSSSKTEKCKKKKCDKKRWDPWSKSSGKLPQKQSSETWSMGGSSPQKDSGRQTKQQKGCGKLLSPLKARPCLLNDVYTRGRRNPRSICVSPEQAVFRVISILTYSLKGQDISFWNPSRVSDRIMYNIVNSDVIWGTMLII